MINHHTSAEGQHNLRLQSGQRRIPSNSSDRVCYVRPKKWAKLQSLIVGLDFPAKKKLEHLIPEGSAVQVLGISWKKITKQAWPLQASGKRWAASPLNNSEIVSSSYELHHGSFSQNKGLLPLFCHNESILLLYIWPVMFFSSFSLKKQRVFFRPSRHLVSSHSIQNPANLGSSFGSGLRCITPSASECRTIGPNQTFKVVPLTSCPKPPRGGNGNEPIFKWKESVYFFAHSCPPQRSLCPCFFPPPNMAWVFHPTRSGPTLYDFYRRQGGVRVWMFDPVISFFH